MDSYGHGFGWRRLDGHRPGTRRPVGPALITVVALLATLLAPLDPLRPSAQVGVGLSQWPPRALRPSGRSQVAPRHRTARSPPG